MATLNSLRETLKQTVEVKGSPMQELTDKQYRSGFAVMRDAEWGTYQGFIIPQLSELIESLSTSRGRLSGLEIGPGPTSVLEHIPGHLRRKIKQYHAFEPRELFATSLEQTFAPFNKNILFPYLDS